MSLLIKLAVRVPKVHVIVNQLMDYHKSIMSLSHILGT
jgi:hypothetical protein